MNSYEALSNMIKPKNIIIDKKTLTDYYAEITIEPLEKGYGITLGNSLRRVLLSSIKGYAITNVKIKGMFHEFSSITGIKDDSIDILLNIKKINIFLKDSDKKNIFINKNGPCIVKASDIEKDENVIILNPDTYICSVVEGYSFNAELIVESGKGYSMLSQVDYIKDNNFIPIDALFNPVLKVNYNITNSRVGKLTNYDKLIIEIWTNGVISPLKALDISSKILRDYYLIFISSPEENIEKNDNIKQNKNDLDDILYKSVDELELSVRSANCLNDANIKLIGDLVQRSENDMLKTRNFGRKSLKEIKKILSDLGLYLGMKINNWKN